MPIFSGIDPGKKVNHSSTVNSAKVVDPPKPSVAEPANIRPVSQKVTVRNAFSTPSILDALRDDPKTDGTGRIAEVNANQYSKSDTAHPFSQQELLEAWKNFVGKIDAPQLKSALSAREPVLTDKWQIEYELDTELQFNRLTLDLKPKLLGYLRQLFGNEAIEIIFTVSTGTGDRPNIPYTDAERWNSLVDKYPVLATLKSKFGLDFEHY